VKSIVSPADEKLKKVLARVSVIPAFNHWHNAIAALLNPKNATTQKAHDENHSGAKKIALPITMYISPTHLV